MRIPRQPPHPVGSIANPSSTEIPGSPSATNEGQAIELDASSTTSTDNGDFTPSTTTPTETASEAEFPILTPTSTTRSTTPTGEGNDSSFPSYYHFGGDFTSRATFFSSNNSHGVQVFQTNAGGRSVRFESRGPWTSLPPGTYSRVTMGSGSFNFGPGGFTSSTPSRETPQDAPVTTSASARFTDAILTNRRFPDNAIIRDCQLSGCNGNHLKITDCTFSDCKFSNSTISDCTFSGSNIQNCKVHDCSFSGSVVYGGSVSDCTCSGSVVR